MPRHQETRQLIGLIWALFGVASIAYVVKKWGKVKSEAEFIPLTFGVCSIFFGAAVGLAPTELASDILLFTFLAMLCLSVVVILGWIMAWLKRN